MKIAKTGLSKTQRKAISLGKGVNVKYGRIQSAEPEVCSFISTIKHYTTFIQTVKKEDHPLTFSSSPGAKELAINSCGLFMPKSHTPQFACTTPVLLYIGLHTVVLFSWLLCSFTKVSRHFYCGFLAETLRFGGCAINSIKGTGKAHAQAQTLNRTPRSFKKGLLMI